MKKTGPTRSVIASLSLITSLLCNNIIALPTTPIAAKTQAFYECGTDEDGCIPGQPDTCICIVNTTHRTSEIDAMTYLNQDSLGCVTENDPSKEPHTAPYPNAAACFAAAYQSEPEPGCLKVQPGQTHPACGAWADTDGTVLSMPKHP